ncbi:cysteine--tRNA ligase [Sneathiella sp.]|uniref:cysteine--tRNA ligase n=1 Tax=Sneathiella sp. TaxID=1964365 RepID=UPI00261F95BE|nr:cysteine--tRNA ligase [Sneathiella sp.]MDF2368062.1 cysteine--tRNA ligase [Sneathiella sp.]
MTLHLYNTAHRKKEEFVPMEPGKVGMYVCGPTVYDRAHIGNARPVVIFDVLARLLCHLGYEVTYVRNITDVDDKIIEAAAKNDENIDKLTARTTAAFHEDMDELNALKANQEPSAIELGNGNFKMIEPRATEHIDGMIRMISTLIEKGHAYEAEGHVLFDVTSMADYGKLSGRNRDDMIAGARVEVAPYKKDPADFVLWKPSTDDMPGWDSPFGRGRPGWHIECSVMSEATLGITFDIHGGGRDLIFPHHENEVAQSCCAHDGAEFARYWVHNGFLTVEGDKMSKSLGNFRTVQDVLEEAPGEAIRLNMLSAHYRQPLDWTAEGVTRAKANLDRLYNALKHLEDVEAGSIEPAAEVIAALEDDLNSPQALTELYALAGEANKASNAAEKARIKGQLLGSGHLLGLLDKSPKEWFQSITVHHLKAESIEARSELGSPVLTSVISKENIEALIAERDETKKQKNYKRADEIRDNLKAEGIVLEDGPGGTTWKRA